MARFQDLLFSFQSDLSQDRQIVRRLISRVVQRCLMWFYSVKDPENLYLNQALTTGSTSSSA